MFTGGVHNFNDKVQARIQDFEMGGGGVNFCNNIIEPKPG